MPIITGAITKDKMTFTVTSGTTTYGTMKIYKVNQNWDSSTITWENQPTSVTYKNLGVRSGYNISFIVTTYSGYYVISSRGGTDTLGKIYQGKTTLLEIDDNDGLSNNFKIGRNLIAGITYYIRVSGNSSNDTGAFKLNISSAFTNLCEYGYIPGGEEIITADGFHMCLTPLSEILISNGINELYHANDSGSKVAVETMYDDWYLYALGEKEEYVYGLIKMREEEFDYVEGKTDRDKPGVTVSFIEFDINILKGCLSLGTQTNKLNLYNEIQRVIGDAGQEYSPEMQEYFADTASVAPYLIAEAYIEKDNRYNK